MAAKPDASGDVRRQLRSSLERHVFSGNQRHFARLNIHLAKKGGGGATRRLSKYGIELLKAS